VTHPIRLSQDARQDIREIKRWYDDQGGPGLQHRFRDALQDVLERMQIFPRGFRLVFEDVRQADLAGFPYGVLYYERGEVLYVISVCHHARDPSLWQRRR